MFRSNGQRRWLQQQDLVYILANLSQQELIYDMKILIGLRAKERLIWFVGIPYFLKLYPGEIISFFAPKGGDYSREAIISNIVHWKLCPKYFVLFSY